MEKQNKHDIEEVLEVGDVVWLVTGEELRVTHVGHEGFDTTERYFSYDEHLVTFFLTKFCYENFIKERKSK